VHCDVLPCARLSSASHVRIRDILLNWAAAENRDFPNILLECAAYERSVSQGLSPRTGGLHAGVVYAPGGTLHGRIPVASGEAFHAGTL